MNPLITSPHSLHIQAEELEDKINQLTEQIDSLPKGTATVYMHKGQRRMQGMINGKRVFFNQKDLPLVKDLILRIYLTKKRAELVHAKVVLNANQSFEDHYLGLAESYLMENPLRAELLEDVFSKIDASLKAWVDAPDPCAAPFQEKRTEKTMFGLLVRSKAEVMIATFLYENGIPFRYEEPLPLGSKTFYPDFTIRDPKTGAFFWFEHFGKMDDPKYVRDNIPKLITYADNGIIPSVNLILTFETKSHQLSFPQIRSAYESVL